MREETIWRAVDPKTGIAHPLMATNIRQAFPEARRIATAHGTKMKLQRVDMFIHDLQEVFPE